MGMGPVLSSPMGAGDGSAAAGSTDQVGSGEHVVRARERWGLALGTVGVALGLVFLAGLAAEVDLLQFAGLAGIALFYGLVRVDGRASSVRSLSFSPSGVVGAVRGGAGPVRWPAPPVVSVAVRGHTRAGFLVPVRTLSGPTRPASVVLLDEGGRVVDAPSVSWMRVREVQTAAEAAGLQWAGRLPFHPVPSVPAVRPHDGALDVAGTLVAQDPHVDEALADHEGASVGLRIGAVGGLALAVVVVSLVVQTAALVVPGIVVVVGATALFVIDAVLDRVRRKATRATVDQMRDHLTWSAAECIVLDVPPSAPSQEAVVVLGPDGEVVAGLRLESAPSWLRAHRRRWLLVAQDPSGGRGVVALPDRSRATPVGARSFDVRIVEAWMTGPDAVASRGEPDEGSRSAGPPEDGVTATAVHQDGDHVDEEGR